MWHLKCANYNEMSFVKTMQIVLYRKEIAACSENHTNHRCTLVGICTVFNVLGLHKAAAEL